jgi:hypothetical protein
MAEGRRWIRLGGIAQGIETLLNVPHRCSLVTDAIETHVGYRL